MENKTCKQCKNQFEITSDDLGFYEKIDVPVPNLCPHCRFIRRCMFRNEVTLYNRRCDLCKKSIVTSFNPKSPYIVYCNNCWDSDNWDPFSYGMDFDPNRRFFDQLGELFLKVPKKAVFLTTGAGQNINSDYANGAGGIKDCYLVFNTGNCENVLYSRGMRECRDSADLYYGNNLENCYETVNVNNSNGVQFGQNTNATIDSLFVLGSSGLQNCFGCVNLRNKNYHFFNEPLSKEEYEKKVKEIQGSYKKTEEVKKKFRDFSLKFPHRENTNLKTVNSSGDYLFECKNVRDSFEVTDGENCSYLMSSKKVKDSRDILGYGWSSELLYECQGVGMSQKVKCSFWVEESHDIEYSYGLRASSNCFGAHCIKNAEYVILNKRYSKEEYEKIKSLIIDQLKKEDSYGAFLPTELAPYAYNETFAQNNFPLKKEEALSQGFRWEDNIQITLGKETLASEQIPDHINDVSDSITKEILACISCGRNYKIIPVELQFYRRMILPIPRKCFHCRHHDRILRRGPIQLFSRTCANCNKKIETTYSSDRPEIVYCEQCYQKEVI